MTRRGFTLMEVNLAIFIMAMGILAMVSLYPLGFRESQQSRDDVAAAALADGILNPLAMALADTNMTWSAWKNICGGDVGGVLPDSGWRAYAKDNDSLLPAKGKMNDSAVINKIVQASPTYGSKARQAVNAAINTCGKNLNYGLVARMSEYGTIQLSFRAVRRAPQLYSAPLYYTEVHFQGMREQ